MFKIAIVGAGVVGLNAAVRIQEELGNVATVTIYTSDVSPNTTGDVSAGLWSPYLLGNTPDEYVIKWSSETQNYFRALWKNGHACEAGLTLIPATRLATENFALPAWKNILIGCNQLPPDQLQKYRAEHKRNYTGGYNFVCFTCEPSRLLPFLTRKFVENGGAIKMKKIENFRELKDYDVVVNCAGLGSKTLAGDARMCAIRGQVARVIAPGQFHVVLDDSDDGKYVIPNAECVILGGTHTEEVNLEPRRSDAEDIVNGCINLVPSLKTSKLIKHMVGLRPGRDRVRLELEATQIDGKPLKIVHNYGHGGSGVTLSYGCANETVQLVKRALNCAHSSKL